MRFTIDFLVCPEHTVSGRKFIEHGMVVVQAEAKSA
jgi:hypothetical protein